MKFIFTICLIVFFLLGLSASVFSQTDVHEEESISIFLSIPFVIMLVSIAAVPLIWERWWENNWNKLKIALTLGIPMAVYFAFSDPHTFQHTLEEYIAFMIYVGSLFVISGGIVVRGEFKCSPRVNVSLIGIGTLLASFIGTPGASMLLIRPLLRINSGRKSIKHVVIFFIFTVSNIGGCLTPLGDPPLFLGYLNGVPFTWTFSLWPQWLFTNAILLSIFYVIDRNAFEKEGVTATPIANSAEQPPKAGQAFQVIGLINFIWLLGVVLSVAFMQTLFPHMYILGYREVIMLTMVALSLKTTGKGLREENRFTYHPVAEVGFLFIGIFMTMMPALVYLKAHGAAFAEKGLNEPWMIFWFTGILSSFLDNAPTYLTFFNLAQGMELAGATVASTGIPTIMLKAISLGAVFMGANTYIGNGPNFMVKAIADESGTKMPSFLGYMLWSGIFLIPTFIIVTIFVFILEII